MPDPMQRLQRLIDIQLPVMHPRVLLVRDSVLGHVPCRVLSHYDVAVCPDQCHSQLSKEWRLRKDQVCQ